MDIGHLPTTTGVYIFKNKHKVLYIGKSVNIKARVQSHLQNAKAIVKERALITESDRVDFQVTDSEFKALLLEARLIRQHHPKYNVIWKDNKSYLYIKIDQRSAYPKVSIVRREDDIKALYFGPFASRRLIEKMLATIRRVVPFCTEAKIGRRPCFYSKIGLCDPCPNRISYGDYSLTDRAMLKKIYRANLRQVIAILSGKTDAVDKTLNHAIADCSAKKMYEDALIYRNRLFLLQRLVNQQHFNQDQMENYNQADAAIAELRTLLGLYFVRTTPLHRIECYDISNLHQQHITGSMVVFTDGLSERRSYRRFRIKTAARSDTEALAEVLRRRFRHRWPRPDLIVVDGGKPQVRAAIATVLGLSRELPVVGLAKSPDRIIIKNQTLRLRNNDMSLNLLRQVRDESHRFAKKYHLLIRNKAVT